MIVTYNVAQEGDGQHSAVSSFGAKEENEASSDLEKDKEFIISKWADNKRRSCRWFS